MKTITAPDRLPASIGRWRLRFVLLGGGVAWLFHLLLAYGIAEFGILSGKSDTTTTGLDLVSCALLVVSGAMLALAAAALRASRRLSRELGETHDDNEDQRTMRFCARFGFITNLVFLVIVAVQSIPIFFFLRAP